VAAPPPDIPGYTLEAELGRGAFGDVWRARRADGAVVALKVLRRAAGDEARLRFRREERAARAAASAHTPAVLDARTDGEPPNYIAYEHLVGETLEARLERESDLGLDEVLKVALDVLDALDVAHQAGVVHRDVKPSNVFLEERGGDVRARLLDFGVAKTAGDADVPLRTTGGKTLGSLAYMAPEQAGSAESADARADLYGVGALAFRALAGRPPFAASTPAVMLALKLERDAPELSAVTGVAWPKAVEAWLAKLLARDPKRRFASAAAARESLEALGDRVQTARKGR
jgi:eukaryotic-like serine/threonine-protein kinase